MRMTGFTKRSLWECFIKVSSDRVEKRSMREKLHLRFQARSRPLKRVSHFISILSTLFSCAAALRKFFYHLNKPVMMCLRVNVQCANCFDLSRNKSDWHFIFIFTGHNRLLPRIAGVPFRLIHSIIFKSEAHTRESNYFDLPHVLLIHCGTLFYFFFIFLFFTHNADQSICFYFGRMAFCCHQGRRTRNIRENIHAKCIHATI